MTDKPKIDTNENPTAEASPVGRLVNRIIELENLWPDVLIIIVIWPETEKAYVQTQPVIALTTSL